MALDEARTEAHLAHPAQPRLESFDVPTATRQPPFRAAARIASASATVAAMGFSISAGMPRSSSGTATSAWSAVGTAMLTASMPAGAPTDPPGPCNPFLQRRSARVRPLRSTTATSRHSGFSA